MKPSTLRVALALSLMLNLGVLGAVAYRAAAPGGFASVFGGAPAAPSLPQQLALDERQLRQWREAERAFLESLASGAAEIRTRRERLIHEIFAPTPDEATIEAERAGIARVQDEQQRLVIRQLLREREMLDAEQRDRLARILLAQPTGASAFEQLHRD
mgnify:CR=1 FL=1